jgi:hypothetical protein
MATTERALRATMDGILSEVARGIRRNGIERGELSGAKAALKVTLEENVRRAVQVYWTPFQAEIPGRSVGLHLEISEPRVHWCEAYISPGAGSWIFSFRERDDGEVELAYYEQWKESDRAVQRFFEIASWYCLVPTDLTWDDVKCEIDPEVGWNESHDVQASSGPEMDKAIQEALKKSTIVWLRWRDQGGRDRTMPVWFIFQNEKIYLISGERQQTIPGVERLRHCDVIMRWKGKNAQVADLPADVRILPHGEEWDTIAEKLAEKRLNIPGLPEDTARRWRDECHVLELTLHS